jgi:hypothetical protein
MPQVSEAGTASILLGEAISQAIDGSSGIARVMALSAVLANVLDGMPVEMRPPEISQLIELLPQVISKLELASRAQEGLLVQPS